MTKNAQFTEVIEQFLVDCNAVSGHHGQTLNKQKRENEMTRSSIGFGIAYQIQQLETKLLGLLNIFHTGYSSSSS